MTTIARDKVMISQWALLGACREVVYHYLCWLAGDWLAVSRAKTTATAGETIQDKSVAGAPLAAQRFA